MKKFIAMLMALLLACTVFTAACGKKETFSIDGDFEFADAEFGEDYAPDVSEIAVIGSKGGKSELTVSVKDGAVKKPDGGAVALKDGKFKAETIGDWSVTLFVEGHEEIAEVTKIISVKDTVAPKISPTAASSLPESAKIGEEIALPEFTVTDHNTLEGELAVKAIRPDGGEAAVNDGKFIVSAAGEWKIVASQKDAAGNEGSYTWKFTAENKTVASNAENALTSYDSIGFEGIWNGYITFTKIVKGADATLNEDKFYGSENVSAKMSMVEGKTTGQIRLWTDIDENDWSGYDYVKFYVYNDTNVSFKIIDCEDDDNKVLMKPNVGIGAWTPVVVPLNNDKIITQKAGWDSREWQEQTAVKSFGIRLIVSGKEAWSGGREFASGNIYFSAMCGGNYEAVDENVLIPVEQGVNPTNVARIRMINHYNVIESTEHAAEGEKASLKLYAIRDDWKEGDDLVITFNGKYYLTAYAGDVEIWVYNATDKALTVTGKTSETLQPFSGKKIKFTASEKEIVIKIGSGNFKTGDAVYFGNVYKCA